MALVVLIKGVNVGGRRSFRPTALSKELRRLDVVNIGSAGTFVVRTAISRTRLREEIQRRLPFEAEVMICAGSDIIRLASTELFNTERVDANLVRFASFLAKRPISAAPIPLHLPSRGDWCVRILDQHDRFALGVYRREMRTIRYLDQLETVFGVPVTTRSWSTISSIVRVLKEGRFPRPPAVR